jgi:hypothetical protein
MAQKFVVAATDSDGVTWIIHSRAEWEALRGTYPMSAPEDPTTMTEGSPEEEAAETPQEEAFEDEEAEALPEDEQASTSHDDGAGQADQE